MDNKKDSTVTNEVENRLTDLFGGSDDSSDTVEGTVDAQDSALRELKAIILSIDWEINDEIMNSLTKEIRRLEGVYKDDKSPLLLLRLLVSAGEYIKKKKANAHPDAITLLNSVYESLEKTVLSKDLSKADKKKLLVSRVNEFKKLKEEIASKKKISAGVQVAPTRPSAPKPEEETPKPDISKLPLEEAFIYAMDEIKQLIKSEFRALREELKLKEDG